MNKYKIALFGCAFVWGFGYVAMDHLIDTSNPVLAIGLRFTVASIVLYIFSFKKINKQYKHAAKEVGALGIVLFFAFFFQTFGLAITTTAKNAFLTATNVIWTPIILALLYKMKIPKKIIFSSMLMIIGIGFVSLDGISVLNIGDVLTLIGALFFALHIVLISRYTNESNLEVVVFGQLLITGVLGLLVAALAGKMTIVFGSEFLIALIFAAVFSSALCFFLQNYGLSKVDSSLGALILSLEAMFGVIAAIIIDGEAVNLITITGFIIMFLAIIVAERN